MPELQALYEEMQETEVNVIGILADVNNESIASTIIEQQGVEYINIVPDQEFMDSFVSLTRGVPVSLFVNSSGEIVGEQVVGARSKDEFKAIIEDILMDIEK